MSGKASETKALYEKLCTYSKKNTMPMHMPGHKRNFSFGNEYDCVYEMDITEIEGFDNLHHPTGVIADLQSRMSQIYGSGKSWMLINGSTCGMLAAISAAVLRHRQQGGSLKRRIVVARNCHKSVYNAVYLNNLDTEYLIPQFDETMGIWGRIEPEALKRLLAESKETEEICAVVVTSPTYEGIVSDISSLSEIAHSYNIPLIVDSAHGAHFYFHEEFPKSALLCGADIVVESLHKTLPSLTQTAVLHISERSLINAGAVEHYIDIYQSTSPSYILMASVSRCMEFVQREQEQFDVYVQGLKNLRERVGKLPNIGLYPCDDISKLVIFSPYLKGTEIYDILLHKYNIQVEMASQRYIIAMTSVCDSKENFDGLYEALAKLDEELERGVQAVENEEQAVFNAAVLPRVKMSFAKVFEKPSIAVKLSSAEGRISAEHIVAYPPGSPLIAAGEVFDREIIKVIDGYIQMGIEIIGVSQGYVNVVDMESGTEKA